MMITGWELALIIFALTVMIVNVVNAVVQVKLLTKFDRIINKSLFVAEKFVDQFETELFKKDDDK